MLPVQHTTTTSTTTTPPPPPPPSRPHPTHPMSSSPPDMGAPPHASSASAAAAAMAALLQHRAFAAAAAAAAQPPHSHPQHQHQHQPPLPQPQQQPRQGTSSAPITPSATSPPQHQPPQQQHGTPSPYSNPAWTAAAAAQAMHRNMQMLAPRSATHSQGVSGPSAPPLSGSQSGAATAPQTPSGMGMSIGMGLGFDSPSPDASVSPGAASTPGAPAVPARGRTRARRPPFSSAAAQGNPAHVPAAAPSSSTLLFGPSGPHGQVPSTSAVPEWPGQSTQWAALPHDALAAALAALAPAAVPASAASPTTAALPSVSPAGISPASRHGSAAGSAILPAAREGSFPSGLEGAASDDLELLDGLDDEQDVEQMNRDDPLTYKVWRLYARQKSQMANKSRMEVGFLGRFDKSPLTRTPSCTEFDLAHDDDVFAQVSIQPA